MENNKYEGSKEKLYWRDNRIGLKYQKFELGWNDSVWCVFHQQEGKIYAIIGFVKNSLNDRRIPLKLLALGEQLNLPVFLCFYDDIGFTNYNFLGVNELGITLIQKFEQKITDHDESDFVRMLHLMMGLGPDVYGKTEIKNKKVVIEDPKVLKYLNGPELYSHMKMSIRLRYFGDHIRPIDIDSIEFDGKHVVALIEYKSIYSNGLCPSQEKILSCVCRKGISGLVTYYNTRMDCWYPTLAIEKNLLSPIKGGPDHPMSDLEYFEMLYNWRGKEMPRYVINKMTMDVDQSGSYDNTFKNKPIQTENVVKNEFDKTITHEEELKKQANIALCNDTVEITGTEAIKHFFGSY